jgi:hypothetical protein
MVPFTNARFLGMILRLANRDETSTISRIFPAGRISLTNPRFFNTNTLIPNSSKLKKNRDVDPR